MKRTLRSRPHRCSSSARNGTKKRIARWHGEIAKMSTEDNEKEERLTFSGKDTDWRQWRVRFYARAAAKGYRYVLDSNVGVPGETAKNLSEEDEKKRKDNYKAYAALASGCKEAAFGVVAGAVTAQLPSGDAALAWKALCNKYEPTTRMSAVQLKREFAQCKLTDTSKDPDEWIQELERLRLRIQTVKGGGQISDIDLIAHIIGNLPNEYSELVTTIESELDDQNSSFGLPQLQQRLRSYYRRRFADGKDDEVALFAGGFKGKCRNCGKIGHKARDCKEKKKPFRGSCFGCGKKGVKKADCPRCKNGNEEEAADLVLTTLDFNGEENVLSLKMEDNVDVALRIATKGKDFFVCDSGASAHMTNSKEHLVETEPINKTVRVGNGQTVTGRLKGKIKTKLRDEEGNEVPTMINDVIYVPKLMCNLLSVGKLTEESRQVVYQGGNAKLVAGKRTIPFEKIDGSTVFGIDIFANNEEALTTLPAGSAVTFEKAHGVLGHPGMDVTKTTMTHWGFKVTGSQKYCEACVKAKGKQKNIKKTTDTIAKEKGERLFIDISSLHRASGGGSRHWALIVDDATRMKWSRFLKAKSDLHKAVVPLVKNLIAKGHKVKKIRLDNAGENKVLMEKLKPLGIEPEWTAPDSPQQNGVVERAFATLAARGRAMMIAAGMDEEDRYKFWAEAFNIAATVSNINPFRRKNEEKNLSPYQRFYGEDARPKWIPHMHVFGEIGQKPTRTKIKSKVADRSDKVMFLGYAEDHAGDCFRVYRFDTDRVVTTRDARWSGNLHRESSRVSFGEEGGSDNDDDDKANNNENNTTDDGFGNDSGDTFNDANGVGSEEGDASRQTASGMTTPIRTPRRSGLRQRDGRSFKEVLESRARSRNLEDDDEREEDVEIALTGAVDSDAGEPKTFRQACASPDKEKWAEAMRTEFANMRDKNVWVPYKIEDMKKGVSVLGTKWVFKVKTDGRYRARLVVKGYNQIPGVDFTESHAPVASDVTIRCVLVESTIREWDVEQIDVETAFLYGDLKEEVYLEKPEGLDEFSDIKVGPDEVLRMNKAGYGLVQASRAWVTTWITFLKDEMGFSRSMADPCLMIKKNESGATEMMVVVYVDDCIIAGPNEKIRWFNKTVKTKFNIKEMGPLKEYVGVEYERTDDGFVAQQSRLIGEIKDTFDVPTKTYKTPAAPGQVLLKGETDEEKVGPSAVTTYRSGVGKLLYLAKLTRPDIASAVRELAKFLDGTTETHMTAMYRAMAYVIDTRDKVMSLEPTKEERGKIVAYSDSNWASDRDTRRSVSGNVIYFGGALVSWRSKSQPCTTLSSSEAEYVALSACICDMQYVRQILESAGVEIELPMTVYVDNTGAIDMAKNWSTGSRTKHIDIRHHHIREAVETEIVDIQFVKSEDNLADPGTKNVTEKLFKKHQEGFGLISRNKEGVNGQSGVTNGTVNGTTTGSGIPKEIRQKGDVTDEGEEQE